MRTRHKRSFSAQASGPLVTGRVLGRSLIEGQYLEPLEFEEAPRARRDIRARIVSLFVPVPK